MGAVQVVCGECGATVAGHPMREGGYRIITHYRPEPTPAGRLAWCSGHLNDDHEPPDAADTGR